jgi:hypothetical protein
MRSMRLALLGVAVATLVAGPLSAASDVPTFDPSSWQVEGFGVGFQHLSYPGGLGLNLTGLAHGAAEEQR